MKTLLLTSDDINKILTVDMVFKAVEAAFIEYGKGSVTMPPKLYLPLNKEEGDFRAMPAFLLNSAGIKWVNAHPRNPQTQGLPSVMAIIILNDPETGFPLSIMDGTQITNYRTGAAGAVAAKYLAKKEAKTLGLVGCGVQAQAQLLAINKLFVLEKVYIHDISQEAMDNFQKNNPYFKPIKSSLEETAQADIICTATPSRRALLKRSWIKAGTHINAIGADAPGKQELDPQILKEAKIVVDDIMQALHSGEVNVALREGLIKKERIYATLGEVVTGSKAGREGDEITVFDSTGLAIQDIAVAKVVYDEAKKRGLGQELKIINAG